MVDAEASFKTLMVSMSLGLISKEYSKGMPSITYNGLCLLKELTPRIKITGIHPGFPDPAETVTPATCPCNSVPRFPAGCFSKFFTFTVATAAVTSLFFWVP